MRWFIVRVLGLWIVSTLITSAVVLVVRSDPESPTLKAVGLTLCGDAPCFRGLKVGSSWDEVQTRFPAPAGHEGSQMFPIDTAGIGARIWRSDDGKTVKHVVLMTGTGFMVEQHMHLTAGEIVVRYGDPCKMFISYGSEGPTVAALIYPELKVYVHLPRSNPYAGTREYQVQLTAPVFELWVSREGEFAFTCDNPPGEWLGQWHGFISADLYLSRLRYNRASP